MENLKRQSGRISGLWLEFYGIYEFRNRITLFTAILHRITIGRNLVPGLLSRCGYTHQERTERFDQHIRISSLPQILQGCITFRIYSCNINISETYVQKYLK